MPATHALQVPARLAPRVALKEPGAQSVQFDTEGNPEPVPYVPAAHTPQVVAELAPREELYRPGVQREHAETPCDALYVPACTWRVSQSAFRGGSTTRNIGVGGLLRTTHVVQVVADVAPWVAL